MSPATIPVLEARAVTVRYRKGAAVLDGIDVTVEPGQVLGLAGPSGCGKSTLARVLALLLAPERGIVSIDGETAMGFRFGARRELRTQVAIIFQQPRLAVDGRLSLRDLMAEPLRATGRSERVAAALPPLIEQVGLTADLLGRRAHEVSDGQLQRACVARALVLEPRYLVCDEMTTMLDASTQAQLVATVEEYRTRTGAGVLAISHDRVLLKRWAHRVLELRQPRSQGAGAT